MKVKDPDKAVALLRRAEVLQRKAGLHKSLLLQTRLRIATVLYESGRFEEAGTALLEKLRAARKWVIGREDIEAADKKYQERIRITREFDSKLKDYERKRNIDENPDFERNLYCKEIYSKLRVFYEKFERFDKALPFAMAEAYPKFENQTHDMCEDDPKPDFKQVLRCLKKLKRETEMQDLEEIFWKYAKKPDSTLCWRMIDELQR